MRRLAASCFGKVGDSNFYHLPAATGILPVLAYHPQYGQPDASEDYEQIIPIAANQCAASASFLVKIISEGLRHEPCQTRSCPGETGFAILHYQSRCIVSIPHFIGEEGKVTIAKVGALRFQVYKQAVVILPLPNDSDLFASLSTLPDRAFCITCPVTPASYPLWVRQGQKPGS